MSDILEDAENSLPDVIRTQLANMYFSYLRSEEHLHDVSKQLNHHIRNQPQCKRLMALEGIGPVNTLELYLTLGDQGKSFRHGREASACIGLTPKQHSTGGVVTLGGIGKATGKKRLINR